MSNTNLPEPLQEMFALDLFNADPENLTDAQREWLERPECLGCGTGTKITLTLDGVTPLPFCGKEECKQTITLAHREVIVE